jgi:predicted HTH domain antitoxin
MKSITLEVPESLFWHPAKSAEVVERRCRFLLALKYFELGEITSGQAAAMAGISRVQFLTEASRHGVAVADLDEDELRSEFGSP